MQKFSTMDKKLSDSITAQFLADYDAAWKSGLFKTQADFCKLTGADKAVLNLVLKGNRPAPMSLVQYLKKIYNPENKNAPIEMKTLLKENEMLREENSRLKNDLDYFKNLVNTLTNAKSENTARGNERVA